MSSCFWQSESCANNIMKLANILVASYSLSYLPPGSCRPSSSSTSYPSRLTHHRTRCQGKTTILLIDTLLAASCHHTRLVVCPAVSYTLTAALTPRISPTYSSTSYSSCHCTISRCFCYIQSCGNHVTIVANILIASYSLSYSTPAS